MFYRDFIDKNGIITLPLIIFSSFCRSTLKRSTLNPICKAMLVISLQSLSADEEVSLWLSMDCWTLRYIKLWSKFCGRMCQNVNWVLFVCFAIIIVFREIYSVEINIYIIIKNNSLMNYRCWNLIKNYYSWIF